MKISGSMQKKNEEIKLNMTAMIDIVFQLLVFFVMTFKIVALEGDFNVKMPLASSEPQETIDEKLTTLITVKLKSGDSGNIAGIDVDDGFESNSFSGPEMFEELTTFVETVLAGNSDPSTAEDVEVEFDIDYNLKYQYTVKAIGSVSGKVVGDTVKTLVEKIKFRDNTQGG
jgi:biopolymer transport protein ExbD